MHYWASDWTRFCTAHGIGWITAPLSPDIRALLIDNLIVLDEDLDSPERDSQAWHELGPWALHIGDERALRRRACGDLIAGKQERQANEFALAFPEWDPEIADRIAFERGVYV